jgi:hypothetical protein
MHSAGRSGRTDRSSFGSAKMDPIRRLLTQATFPDPKKSRPTHQEPSGNNALLFPGLNKLLIAAAGIMQWLHDQFDYRVVTISGFHFEGLGQRHNVNSAAGAIANATITNSQVLDDTNVGIRIDTTSVVGSVINATIDNVTLSNDGTGILVKAPTGTGTVEFMLTDSRMTLNADHEIILNGAPSSPNARVGNNGHQ